MAVVTSTGVRGLVAVATLALLLAAPALYRPDRRERSAPPVPAPLADSVLPVAPTAAPASPALSPANPATPAPASERPAPGLLPDGVLALAPSQRHVIAVDAARSRLFLLERGDAGWSTVADYPVSLGRAGIDKRREGDARTPLGVYQITSRLGPPGLDPFYGDGALTLDYPNALDRAQGRGGSRIWIHGSADEAGTRPPRDTDGCVVLTRLDQNDLMARVDTHTTPVLIARDIVWRPADELEPARQAFEAVWRDWQRARRVGPPGRYAHFYAPGVRPAPRHARLDYKDLTLLAWPDGPAAMQATFGEIPKGRRTGLTRRQHWRLEQGQWQIFDEGVLQ